MDQLFWQSIEDTDFSIPEQSPPSLLIDELLSSLGSADPSLREGSKYHILETWIERGYYTPEEMRYIARIALQNMTLKLGEKGTDSVFLRSYSILVLNMIIDQDNRQPFLEDFEIREWMKLGLAYFATEEDLRGYIETKGWAHAMAHAADLLTFLSRSRYMQAIDLKHILVTIANKLNQPTEHVYTYLEDERLAYSVMSILRQNQVDLPFLKTWVHRFVSSAGQSPWNEIYITNVQANMRHNIIAFLRSLYFQLQLAKEPPTIQDNLLLELEKAFQAFDLGFYTLFS